MMKPTEEEMKTYVINARARGATWRGVAEVLNMTQESARRKYKDIAPRGPKK